MTTPTPTWEDGRELTREEWEKCKQWYKESDVEALLMFKLSLIQEDSVGVMMQLMMQPKWADIACRLASLALSEVALRVHDEKL